MSIASSATSPTLAHNTTAKLTSPAATAAVYAPPHATILCHVAVVIRSRQNHRRASFSSLFFLSVGSICSATSATALGAADDARRGSRHSGGHRGGNSHGVAGCVPPYVPAPAQASAATTLVDRTEMHQAAWSPPGCEALAPLHRFRSRRASKRDRVIHARPRSAEAVTRSGPTCLRQSAGCDASGSADRALRNPTTAPA